jgi:hypothetical protein
LITRVLTEGDTSQITTTSTTALYYFLELASTSKPKSEYVVFSYFPGSSNNNLNIKSGPTIALEYDTREIVANNTLGVYCVNVIDNDGISQNRPKWYFKASPITSATTTNFVEARLGNFS